VDLKNAQDWRKKIRRGSQELGVYVGKAAASVWLYDGMNDFEQAQTTFLLALKYYQQLRNKSSCSPENIKHLSATGFRGISVWACRQKWNISYKNLGVAYFTLHEWEAYRAKGDHDAAIKTSEDAVIKFPTKSSLWTQLSKVYEAKGDHDAAIKTLEDAVVKLPAESLLWEQLSKAYEAKGDHDADDQDVGGRYQVPKRIVVMKAS
jgi:tetratricopeptide (TPR) repeat protein